MSDIEQFVISAPSEITGNRWQVMRPLTPEEYTSLKDGISQDGIISSIVVDASGDVVDGHTRLEAWAELLAEGKRAPATAPVIRRKDLSDPKSIKAVARKLNLQRRQLSAKDRRIVVKSQIVDTPEKSDNAISVMLGVDRSVVKRVREDAVSEGLISASTHAITAGGAQPRRQKQGKGDKGVETTPSLPPNPSKTTISCATGPLQTTIDQHIEEASQNGSPASVAEDKSPGTQTVKQAVDAGAELPQKPVRTREQKAYYDLFPYLNSLLELDPMSVAQASIDPWFAEHSTILFKEVIPWFEQFFETLERQGKPQIRAIK